MTMFFPGITARGSFKRQIILAFVVGFFLLVSAFAVYQVNSQKEDLYSDSSDATTGLAQSLAVSSLSWVLANDVVGLQEVVHSFQNYPELRYAMVISPSGQVLAHSDATKVGQFVADPQSLALIKAPPGIRILKNDALIADVAVPVSVNGRPVGWARVALGREDIAGDLRMMVWRHVLFVVSATLLALLAALLIANRLGSRIGVLVKVAGVVQAGNLATRARIPPGEDEITKLADTFNQMLDALALNEERLRTVSLYNRSLIEASLDPLVTISAEGKITDVNRATEAVTGRSRSELIGTDFSDYFTEPDKAREGYQQVFLRGSVTDFPLALRRRDGHVTEVLYNASVYQGENGEVLGVLASARDITERKLDEEVLHRLNRELRAISSCNQTLMRAEDEQTLLNEICQIVCDQAGYRMAWVGYAENDETKTVRPVAWSGFDSGYVENARLSWADDTERGQGLAAMAIRSGRTFCVQDFANEPEMVPWREDALSRGYRSGVALPLKDESAKVFGVLLIYSTQINAFVPDEMRLLEELAGDLAFGIAVLRTRNERKRTEQALREHEHFLDSVIEHLPNMLFVKDAKDLKFVRFNKAGEALLGYPRDQLIGKNDRDFFPREQADFFISKDREIIARRELLDIPEEPISTKFLGQRYLHTRKIPIFSDDGRPLYLLGISEDITERKRAEEKLLRSEHGLAEAQRIVHLGNWDLDLETNVLTWSDEIYRIFEIDPEKFGASFDAFLNAIHPDDRELVNKAYTDSVNNKIPYDIEHRLLMKDGRVKYVNEKCETYCREDGRALRSVGTVYDITERRKVAEELRRYKDHLEELVQQRTADLVLARNAAEAANRAKSVFLSSMSHELRTPMNAILGFSSMMRKDPLLQDEQRQNLDIINRSGEHLLTLINDVLEMAKIEAGRVQVESAPFDLGSLVRDVTDMMHMRAQENGLQLLIDQSSQFPRYIKGDEARVRQVLINLLGNAVKFTRHGGVTVRFGLKPHTTPQRLLIEVEDSGIGISAADQKRVFEPFVQFGETAAQQGTGLGLSIARQFVQLMGGTISFESTLGKGSTFRVELPMERVASADVAKPESTVKGEIVGLAPGQPEYRILIVEDQLDNQLLLSKLMKNVGFQAKVTENGAQAVGLFQSWRPQLIWMDRRMPVMDGLEATRRIRELPGGREVKIVAVTASVFMEQRDEILKAGMDDVVRKPYRFNEIYECMAQQLGVQYTYAEAQDAQEVSDLVLTAGMLAVLPPDLHRELHDAAESLEGERITAVIGQVASFDSKLHKTLSRLADNFDYPAILKALQTNPPVTVT
ncbi:MAG: PAS domain S-box protein [Giesbergeria sp.]|nr:PAS domain S-box protein [Giesbergeria sp.]